MKGGTAWTTFLLEQRGAKPRAPWGLESEKSPRLLQRPERSIEHSTVWGERGQNGRAAQSSKSSENRCQTPPALSLGHLRARQRPPSLSAALSFCIPSSLPLAILGPLPGSLPSLVLPTDPPIHPSFPPHPPPPLHPFLPYPSLFTDTHWSSCFLLHSPVFSLSAFSYISFPC